LVGDIKGFENFSKMYKSLSFQKTIMCLIKDDGMI